MRSVASAAGSAGWRRQWRSSRNGFRTAAPRAARFVFRNDAGLAAGAGTASAFAWRPTAFVILERGVERSETVRIRDPCLDGRPPRSGGEDGSGSAAGRGDGRRTTPVRHRTACRGRRGMDPGYGVLAWLGHRSGMTKAGSASMSPPAVGSHSVKMYSRAAEMVPSPSASKNSTRSPLPAQAVRWISPVSSVSNRTKFSSAAAISSPSPSRSTRTGFTPPSLSDKVAAGATASSSMMIPYAKTVAFPMSRMPVGEVADWPGTAGLETKAPVGCTPFPVENEPAVAAEGVPTPEPKPAAEPARLPAEKPPNDDVAPRPSSADPAAVAGASVSDPPCDPASNPPVNWTPLSRENDPAVWTDGTPSPVPEPDAEPTRDPAEKPPKVPTASRSANGPFSLTSL